MAESRKSEKPLARAAIENTASRFRILNITRRTDIATAAEIANTSATRQKGLLGRTGLPEGGGLWIVPCESVHTFFMKFPIDLVYINRGKVVTKVCPGVRPWRISACFSAHSIIELPVGAIHRSRTTPGDQLEFEIVQPAASEDIQY